MTNRKTILKTSLAAFLALGTLAGATAPAAANGFSFSWSTPQGTFSTGPNGHIQQQRVRPQHVRPQQQQISRQQARQSLRQAGFRNISFVTERRNDFVFQVQGRHGQRQVAVNKRNGRIS